MNRQIKFRAWTGYKMEYNVMVGHLGAFYCAGLDPNDSASLSSANTIYGKETPIMQFTGFLDEDGIEIYENDIIEVRQKVDCTGHSFVKDIIVGWNYDLLEFIRNNTDKNRYFKNISIRKIGNMHENNACELRKPKSTIYKGVKITEGDTVYGMVHTYKSGIAYEKDGVWYVSGYKLEKFSSVSIVSTTPMITYFHSVA
jgi:hypothetical protein